VRRVANKGTYVTRFTGEEVEQVYLLRTELELLGLRWAKSRVTEGDLLELERTGDGVVDAARRRDARLYYERDLTFHRQCWELSRNKFLCRSLERIVSPLFAFVISHNETAMAETVAREHLNIVNALRNLQEPEFSSTIRSILSGFALTGCRQWRGQAEPRLPYNDEDSQ
jgi:DNA-binding GntR family transcriptional regulator